MAGRAYYSEIEPYAVQWLKNLIAAGLIADGDVDDRSIDDVRPADLAGYTQCHFFAGLGGWSYALRLAGWPDTRPVWTGSCPCQPFSQAGKGAGFADERHLWPAFHWLVAQCRPGVVFGEQVGSPAGLGWWDLVATDLEALGYAVGESDLPAAGVGAPHLRQRLYWLAVAGRERCDGERLRVQPGGPRAANIEVGRGGEASELAIAKQLGSGAGRPVVAGRGWSPVEPDRLRENGRMGDASSPGLAVGSQPENQPGALWVEGPAARTPEPVRWDDAEWIWCRDGKHRPTEPGLFPLVDGLPRGVGRGRAHLQAVAALPRAAQGSRVGRLRAYGNAIVPHVAATFIQAADGAIEEYQGGGQ